MKNKSRDKDDQLNQQILHTLLYDIILIYETGHISKEFGIKTDNITPPKKVTIIEYSNYNTISILPHSSKILL